MFFKSLRLYEVGAAILFFGSLSQQLTLQHSATAALAELSGRGYRIPGEDDPVRVFPALTDGNFSSKHAGGWRPGVIYLRSPSVQAEDGAVYLRHELFHEASYRSCGGKLPGWAEEAAAMQFSGEMAGLADSALPAETELHSLKQHIRDNNALDARDRQLLGRLLVNVDWPGEPCRVSAKLQALLGPAFRQPGSSAYLLMSLVSGRILETGGDQADRFPPGSLLKIPYAAALDQANPEVLAAELAASNTEKLLARRWQFQLQRYRLLMSAFQNIPAESPGSSADWRALLGERDAQGRLALQASLPELALAMRAALLSQPDYFRGLRLNGISADSTLAGQNPRDKQLLRQMQAMAKTGSVSTASGQSLLGHLLLAWPAEHPLFLAIFRQADVKGAALLPKAAALLRLWQQNYPERYASVRVRLLTATAPNSWEAQSVCPTLATANSRFSYCGEFRIISTAAGSRSERLVSGILHNPPGGQAVVLETDVQSYVEAVMAAEAQNLTGSAKAAMQAVIAWNAGHGKHRHSDSGSLCDTTHCMVFLGRLPEKQPVSSAKPDMALVGFLDKLATDAGLTWLPFANGGDAAWQRQITAPQLRTAFAENRIVDIRRERRKNGELFIHLYYADSEETLSCEVFRNTLKLPSCPDAIVADANQEVWHFQGIGTGHGLGLSIFQAQALAEHGRSAEEILRDAYAAK